MKILLKFDTEIKQRIENVILNLQDSNFFFLMRIYIYLRTYLFKKLIYLNLFPQNGLNLLMALSLQKGDVFLDIGANVGWVSQPASILVGNKGKVYSFEPAPATAKILEYRKSVLQLKNVEIVKSAVGDTPGNLKLYVTNVNYGGSNSLKAAAIVNQPIVSEVDVEVITLDQFMEINAIERVKFIKMDIQGAEFDAILGAQQLFNSQYKPILYIEIEESALNSFGHSCRSMLNKLKGMGYRLYSFRNNKLTRVNDEKNLPTDGHDDLICLSETEHVVIIDKLKTSNYFNL